ncbi:hypothetical protein, partial [Raoultella ornithinolytica]|uniref:hypothetical protein n=1 Tax=Raoultella ornithinolytica TaxID=54291 RepID=UPI001967C8E5
LALYSHLKGRTLLQHPTLKRDFISLVAKPATQKEAIKALETMFHSRGIATIPDGEKFVMIVPDSLTNFVSPRAANIAAESAGKAGAQSNAALPSGSVYFLNTPFAQVAMVYKELVGASKLDGIEKFVRVPVTFQSTTPLTRAEVVYALDTMFEWDNIKMVREEGGVLRVEHIQK